MCNKQIYSVKICSDSLDLDNLLNCIKNMLVLSALDSLWVCQKSNTCEKKKIKPQNFGLVHFRYKTKHGFCGILCCFGLLCKRLKADYYLNQVQINIPVMYMNNFKPRIVSI